MMSVSLKNSPCDILKAVRKGLDDTPLSESMYEVSVEDGGIQSVLIKPSPFKNDGRFNGYVMLSPTHPAAGNPQEHVYEEITFHSGFMIGFDTLHIYNNIPPGMSPLTYTKNRLLRFVADLLVPVATTNGVAFTPEKLPKGCEDVYEDIVW